MSSLSRNLKQGWKIGRVGNYGLSINGYPLAGEGVAEVFLMRLEPRHFCFPEIFSWHGFDLERYGARAVHLLQFIDSMLGQRKVDPSPCRSEWIDENSNCRRNLSTYVYMVLQLKQGVGVGDHLGSLRRTWVPV